MPEYFEDEFVIKSRDGKRRVTFDISKLTQLYANYVLIPNTQHKKIATIPDIIEQKDVKTIDYDTTGGEAGGVLGRLKWNSIDKTLDLGVSDGSVTLQLGQELHTPCLNKTSPAVTIADFRVVRITGSMPEQGGNKRVTIELAQANSLANSETTYGITTQNIPHNEVGFVTTYGLINDVDTSSFTEGAVLYLSATTAGMMTTVAPSSPNFAVPVAVCVLQHSLSGKILVNVKRSTPSLNDLTDVVITGATDGDTLVYAGGAWENTEGAMFKNVYDTNGDGRVNVAEGLQTSGDPDLYTSTNLTTQLNNRAKLDTSNSFAVGTTNTINGTLKLNGGSTLDLEVAGNIIAGGGLNISPTELGYIDGVTSNLQTQLDGKASLSGNNTYLGTNTFTNGAVIDESILDLRTMMYILVGGGAGTQIDATEVSHLNGVTSNIQTQFTGKAGLTSTNTFSGSNIFNILTLLKFARTSLTSSTILATNGNFFELNTGATTTTLPTGNDGRLVVLFKNFSIGNATVTGNINGVAATNIILTTQYDFAILISNGTTWIKLLCRIGGVISGT